MVRFYNYDIVFAEIPDEVSLALNITGCPNRCPGCHSTHLQQNIGDVLDADALEVLMNIYGKAITCVCFMGGDGRASEINALAAYMRTNYPGLKTGWYSGREEMDSAIDLKNFNYIKLGPYIEERGPLSSPTTNQRLLKVLPDLTLNDITYRLTK